MNDHADIVPTDPDRGGGAAGAQGAAGPMRRLAMAVTPDLQRNPRDALRDMRIRDPLRTPLGQRVLDEGLTLADAMDDDPFADAEGNMLKRRFSVLRAKNDEVVLLQIPDWIANDGAQVGALTELITVFENRKVRLIAQGVESPDFSVLTTLPKLWKAFGNVDLEFVPWRYVQEVREGKRPAAAVFGVSTAATATAEAPPDAVQAVRRVFISSTGLDLEAYREVARDVCIGLGFLPIMMEYFEAMGLGATAGSQKKLDQADLYVGIFAHRYGFIEPGYPNSVTEMEFDHAAKRQIPRLCFVVDPTFAWPPDSWDPENHEQMQRFKQRIDSLIRGQFTTPDSLEAMLTQALLPHKR